MRGKEGMESRKKRFQENESKPADRGENVWNVWAGRLGPVALEKAP